MAFITPNPAIGSLHDLRAPAPRIVRTSAPNCRGGNVAAREYGVVTEVEQHRAVLARRHEVLIGFPVDTVGTTNAETFSDWLA